MITYRMKGSTLHRLLIILTLPLLGYLLIVYTEYASNIRRDAPVYLNSLKVTPRSCSCKALEHPPSSEVFSTEARPSEQARGRAHTPKGPVSVLILAYQRSGSSFFGKLFDKNPDALYVYEPLDALYTARYGTRDGWNVPGDIHFYWNGTKRNLPTHEITSAVENLQSYYSCNTSNIPSEYFIHRYWQIVWTFMTGLLPVTKCLKDAGKIEARLKLCYRYISKTCPEIFGQNYTAHQYCYRKLTESMREFRTRTKAVDFRHDDKFTLYQACVAKQRKRVTSCVDILRDKCTRSNIRVIKTVRAGMEIVEPLLARMPNLRVVHLIRDPRPVVLSRMREKSYRSHFSDNDMIREAQIYCRRVAHDVYYRRRLEKIYPDSFLQVIYDQFVERPLEYAQNIYDFVGRGLPREVGEFLRKSADEKNSSFIARRWQKTLSYHNATSILKDCRELFSTLDHNWLQ